MPGATDVIRDIARATVEAASLIDEYTRLSFVGTFSRPFEPLLAFLIS